ncbi:hypothetical protein OJE16_01325 [Pantoea tagorei]
MFQRRSGAGNSAENPERAREAGRKGGQISGSIFKKRPRTYGGGRTNRRQNQSTPLMRKKRRIKRAALPERVSSRCKQLTRRAAR